MEAARRRVVLALITFAAALALPPAAHATHPACERTDSAYYGCGVSVGSLATYKGWAHTFRHEYCGGAAPGGMVTIETVRAWRWTSIGWRATTLRGGERVYVWPFASGWSWVWTSSTGWLAMQDHLLRINPVSGCYRHEGEPLPQ